MNFWGVDPGLFVLWLSFSHLECAFASMSLGDYGSVLSAWNQNVCFCCLELLARQFSSFPVLVDVIQRISMLAETELAFICGEFFILWSFTMLLLYNVKSLKALVWMVAKCIGIQEWVWSLIHKIKGSLSATGPACCLTKLDYSCH